MQHRKLVDLLHTETKNRVGNELACFIQCDVGCNSLPPQTEEGFRPDLYYQFSSLMIIGEAKTEIDLERKHSKAQYRSYLRKCSLFMGNAVLIMAVPWQCRATIKNMLNRMRKEYPGEYEIVILEGMAM